jgi:hypothetical protein
MEIWRGNGFLQGKRNVHVLMVVANLNACDNDLPLTAAPERIVSLLEIRCPVDDSTRIATMK